MQRFKPYVLPTAIVLGLLLHRWVALASGLIPYLIFSILLLNFSAVDLGRMRFSRLDAAIMAFQAVASVALYYGVRMLMADTVLAEAALMAVMCPVAASVVVISSALGASRLTTTGYTIYGNLLIAVIAPIYFAFIGENTELAFWESAWMIFRRIASVIALPFFIALIAQWLAPKVKTAVGKAKEWAFPLWALALLITLGQTIDYIFLYHEGNERNIWLMGCIAVAVCVLQFGIGKKIGERWGERVAGGQLMGQKNTAIGIWMASIWLNPLSSVVLAFYSIAQNLFNSWQLYRYEKRPKQK